MQQSLNNVGSGRQGPSTANQKRAQTAPQGPTEFGGTDSYTYQRSESLLRHVISD